MLLRTLNFLLEPGFLVEFDSTDRSTSRGAYLLETNLYFGWLPRTCYAPNPPPPHLSLLSDCFIPVSPKNAKTVKIHTGKNTTIFKQESKSYM